MELTAPERQSLAADILRNAVFTGIMDKLEREAINRAVTAPGTDHAAQQSALAEVRAVRAFRSNCETLLQAVTPKKNAPA